MKRTYLCPICGEENNIEDEDLFIDGEDPVDDQSELIGEFECHECKRRITVRATFELEW